MHVEDEELDAPSEDCPPAPMSPRGFAPWSEAFKDRPNTNLDDKVLEHRETEAVAQFNNSDSPSIHTVDVLVATAVDDKTMEQPIISKPSIEKPHCTSPSQSSLVNRV